MLAAQCMCKPARGLSSQIGLYAANPGIRAEVIDAAVQQSADPVDRIPTASAMPGLGLLYVSAHVVDDGVREPHDVEWVKYSHCGGRRGPQWRMVAHPVSSPRDTKVMPVWAPRSHEQRGG